MLETSEKKVETVWESTIQDRKFRLKKIRERKELFCYNVRTDSENERFVGSSATGFYSPRDLSREEVERAPQFATFIAGSLQDLRTRLR